MAGESIVQVNSGSGPKLHTWQRTVGAQNVEDELVLLGEPHLAGYSINNTGVSVATSTSHILQIMAGSSLNVYLRRLQVYQLAAATTAAIQDLTLLRLTTAGTGGTALTPSAMDPADAAAGAAGMTLPTVKGTTGAVIYRVTAYFIQTVSASLLGQTLLFDLDFDRLLRGKVPKIAAGTANGLALQMGTGVAAATVSVTALISESSY